MSPKSKDLKEKEKIKWSKFGRWFLIISVLTILMIVIGRLLKNYVNHGIWTIMGAEKENLINESREKLKKNFLLRGIFKKKIESNKENSDEAEKIIRDIFSKYSR